MFGGNSNWRGPIWFPVNFLLIRALRRFYRYFGDDVLVVGTVGRLDYQKAPEILIEAVSRLTSRAMLVWAGDGPLFDAARQQVAALGLQDRILLLGNRTDVPTILPAFDVFAMASRYEGQAGPSIQPWRLAVKLLRTSPMLTTSQAILMMQSRFDWLLVAAFASYSALANYAVANKATELLVLSGSILGRNALPWLVEGWSHPGVARTVRWLGVAVNFAGLALAFLGWPLLHLVFNDKYAGAAPVIPVLAALTPALTLYQVLQFALLAKQRTRDVVVASGLALGAQVAIDLGAIPTLGIMGAALGMCGFTAVAFPLALSVALKRNLLTRSTAAELGFAAGALPLVLLATLGIGRL